MDTFEYDPARLPTVEKDGKYYQVGGWTFSAHPEDDGDLAYAEDAVYAWIAWCNFLQERGEQ